MNTWTGIGLSLFIVALTSLTAGMWLMDWPSLGAWLLGSIGITRYAVPFVLVGACLSKCIDRLGIDRLFINWFLHVCAGFGLGLVALVVFGLNQSVWASLLVTWTGVAAAVAFWTGTRHVHRLFWMRFWGIGVPAAYMVLVAVDGILQVWR